MLIAVSLYEPEIAEQLHSTLILYPKVCLNCASNYVCSKGRQEEQAGKYRYMSGRSYMSML